MRVDESWRSNESESCDSHPLSSSFDQAFILIKEAECMHFPRVPIRYRNTRGSLGELEIVWKHSPDTFLENKDSKTVAYLINKHHTPPPPHPTHTPPVACSVLPASISRSLKLPLMFL